MLNTGGDIKPTPFQQKVLAYRSINIMNGGGRGSGKSVSLMLDLLSHCTEFGQHARPFVFRESHAGLLELSEEFYHLAVSAFGKSVQRNKADGTVKLPTGGIVTFTNLGDVQSYAKLQGRSASGLFGDEAGNWTPQALTFFDRARSNLRVPPGYTPHIHLTANPAGRCHSQLRKRYISKAPPWTPFEDDFGETWVWTTSTYEDNPHVDQVKYKATLRASTGGDQNLADAWLDGSWDTLGGGMFDEFSLEQHVITEGAQFAGAKQRRLIGADWGSSAPATAIYMSELQQPVYYCPPSPDLQPFTIPTGSIIIHDECDTAVDDNDLSVGSGATVQAFADMVKDMVKRNHLKKCPHIVCDDAKGLQSETVIRMFNEAGLPATKPYKKDRKGGWQLLRQLLNNTVTGDGPGIYFNARAVHLITTIPDAPRSTLQPEDVDPRWQADHWLDGMIYGVRHLKMQKTRHGRIRTPF